MHPPSDTLRPERVLSALRSVEDLRIWIVGDVMVDEYVEGSVARVSPEAPVPVVQVQKVFGRLGGAANVANGVAALGAEARLCGVVGADTGGDDFLAMCSDAGIDARAVVRVDGRATTRKLRVLAQHQQMLRLDWEATGAIPMQHLHPAVARLNEVGPPQAIILSDYGKGVLSSELITHLIEVARRAGAAVIVDPKTRDLSRYAGATIVTPNLRELEVAAGCSLQEHADRDIEVAAREVLSKSGVETLLVTMGERGMMLVPRAGPADKINTLARDVYDVTGAGDTVVAALSVAMAAGLRPGEAARFANASAGVVVGKLGTAVARPAEIAAVLAARLTDKLLERAPLREQVAWWRLQGKKIVFTNGCYDLVHSGHISLLREAAKAGDVLIVGLNSDASVARLKGPTRPLIGERERADLIGALECVDAVTIFDEDTPLELIRELLPDVLVKGGDYALEQVVGRDVVESNGGIVKLIPLVPGRSTSELVKRIRHSDA